MNKMKFPVLNCQKFIKISYRYRKLLKTEVTTQTINIRFAPSYYPQP